MPVAFGLTKSGYPVIRAFETFGDTKTIVPEWKFFRVDRISSWRDTNKVFHEIDRRFNPNGDRTMRVVYNIADFNKQSITNAPTTKPKTKSEEYGDIFKTSGDLELDKLSKLKDSLSKGVLNISDFKTSDSVGRIKTNNSEEGPKTKSDEINRMDRSKKEKNKLDSVEDLRELIGDYKGPITLDKLKELLKSKESR